MAWKVVVAAALIGSAMRPARAQTLPVPASAVTGTPGSNITVTLVTFGLGHEVFERFGHNALWLHDATTLQDSAYHWGLFSFDEPGFLLRFLTGDTNYWMGAVDARLLVESERSRGRPVTLQRLNLTPAQALQLRDFVRWNAREEHKFYRYDYFGDNCSTRLRDALDSVLGGAIRRATDTVLTSTSYRRESLRLTDGVAPVQAGIDVALGRPADVPLTQWKSFFIPMRLRDAIRNIRVQDSAGTSVPLVAQEQVLPLPAGAVPVPELLVAPHLVPRYLTLGLLMAALVAVLRVMMLSRRSAAWGLALLGSAWSLFCGVLGVILLLAWTATKHVFWAWNENLLLLTPLSLALVVLLPAAILSRRRERAARMIAAAIAAVGLVALVLALLPGGQENLAIVVMLLPVHLAIAWALALPRAAASA
ncbi:DUF4105 domain-containing protein [soil metagenome]